MKQLLIFVILIQLPLWGYSQLQDFKWALSIGGNSVDYSYFVTTDQLGNVYTIGDFNDTVDFDPGPGVTNLISPDIYSDVFIQKHDENGNLIWVKQIANDAPIAGHRIMIDSMGDIYCTGVFIGTVDFDPGPATTTLTSPILRTFFLKLTSSGDFIWVKSFEGNGKDLISGITTDKDGNFYLSGAFSGSVDFDPGPSSSINQTNINDWDICIVKLDSNGELIWVRTIPGPNTQHHNYAFTIALDSKEDIIATGTFDALTDFDPGPGSLLFDPNLTENLFVLKLGKNGNFIWAKHLKGGETTSGEKITIDRNDNIYLNGSFEGTVDFDPGPALNNLTSLGLTDIFITKLNANGDLVWVKQMGNITHNSGYSIDVDQNGNTFHSGIFRGTIDIDPGPGVFNLSTGNNTSIFFLMLDPVGNFLWANHLKSTGTVSIPNIHLDRYNNLYTAGYYSETADFDLGPATYNHTSRNSSTDIFILKMGMQGVSIDDPLLKAQVSLYPNPTESNFNLTFDTVLPDVEVSIYDVQGRLVQSSNHLNTDEINIEFNQVSGTYLIQLRTSQGYKTLKLVKK